MGVWSGISFRLYSKKYQIAFGYFLFCVERGTCINSLLTQQPENEKLATEIKIIETSDYTEVLMDYKHKNDISYVQYC